MLAVARMTNRSVYRGGGTEKLAGETVPHSRRAELQHHILKESPAIY